MKKEVMEFTVDGGKVISVWPVNSRYTPDILDIAMPKKKTEMPLRITMAEVAKLFKGKTFRAVPKLKYAYLELIS